MAPGPVDAASAALSGIRQGLVADGYDLQIESIEGAIARVRITAGPQACEECLVPKQMMAAMLQASLSELPGIQRVEVLYPGD